jgi:general secretion pathway protein D
MKSVVMGLAVLGLLLGVTPSVGAANANQNGCRKLPPGQRVVKLSLKPDTEIGDLLAWISSVTCKQFVLPGTIDAGNKKVTIIAPQPITADEAYRLFLDALDSVGLTVVPAGNFLRVIETTKAKTSAIPVYLDSADRSRQ